MQLFLQKTSLALVLVFVFIFVYGAFCDYFFAQKQHLDLAEKKQWVLAQEGGDYDYAVLGSSRAFGAFDMNLLDSLTEWEGINIGANGSGFKDNYLVLSIFLKRNRVDRLFLQVDMATLNSKTSFSNEFHAFTFLPYWEEAAVREILTDEIPVLGSELTRLFPQWRYLYFNKYFAPKELLRRSLLRASGGNNYSLSQGGNTAVDQAISLDDFRGYSLPVTADSEDLGYLHQIVSLTDREGIELIFFTAPRYLDIQEAVIPVLARYPNVYIHPLDWDSRNSSLFQDQGHLNRKGQREYTGYFYNLLKPEISQ